LNSKLEGWRFSADGRRGVSGSLAKKGKSQLPEGVKTRRWRIEKGEAVVWRTQGP